MTFHPTKTGSPADADPQPAPQPARQPAPLPQWLDSPAPFRSFVAAWQACTLPKEQFTHAAHVAIAAHFIVTAPNDALDHIRSGIRRFNESVGGANTDTAGYHETLTRFWYFVIERTVRNIPSGPSADSWPAACAAVRAFGHHSTLHTAYYTYDVVRSTEARRSWHPPDRPGPIPIA